jgi:4-hydroxybenzoate polyprenyltransferase
MDPTTGLTATAVAADADIGMLRALVREVRPRQWSKNLIVFAALIFSGNVGDAERLWRAALAFVVFCLLSGAAYLINDIADAGRDRLHPKKRFRPIAAGQLGTRPAAAMAAAIAACGLVLAFVLNTDTFITAASFFVLLLAYSFVIKSLVILDAMAIAAGFVLRVIAGATAIVVPISPWIILCTALIALFLGLVKRRYELVTIEDPVTHRPTLEHYSQDFLDTMISTLTAATIVAYSMYTFFVHDSSEPWMMLTIPFVLYGMFRYLYLVHLKGLGGNPEEILVSDVPLIVDIVLFVVVALVVLQVQG